MVSCRAPDLQKLLVDHICDLSLIFFPSYNLKILWLVLFQHEVHIIYFAFLYP